MMGSMEEELPADGDYDHQIERIKALVARGILSAAAAGFLIATIEQFVREARESKHS